MDKFINKIILGNSIEVLKTIPNKSINIIITSPPYKDSDNYSDQLIYDIFSECFRIQKSNSLCMVNFGHMANQKSRPFKVVNILEDIGYKLNDTITWIKPQFSPIQGHRRVNNVTEFIFMFYKGKMPKIDRLSIGVPYEDKSNMKRYSSGKDLRCGGNVWKIGYETITRTEQKLHNDRFPLQLPMNCIKLSGIKDDAIVLDPFSGSGTTCLAAKTLNKNYIGIEMNEEHYNTSLIRLKIREHSVQ